MTSKVAPAEKQSGLFRNSKQGDGGEQFAWDEKLEPSKESNTIPAASTLADWEAHYGAGVGHLFFQNNVTKVVTWDKPEGFKIPEWIKSHDYTSGHDFYYNTVTGESTWDPPKEFTNKEELTHSQKIQNTPDDAEKDGGAQPKDV